MGQDNLNDISNALESLNISQELKDQLGSDGTLTDTINKIMDGGVVASGGEYVGTGTVGTNAYSIIIDRPWNKFPTMLIIQPEYDFNTPYVGAYILSLYATKRCTSIISTTSSKGNVTYATIGISSSVTQARIQFMISSESGQTSRDIFNESGITYKYVIFCN